MITEINKTPYLFFLNSVILFLLYTSAPIIMISTRMAKDVVTPITTDFLTVDQRHIIDIE